MTSGGFQDSVFNGMTFSQLALISTRPFPYPLRVLGSLPKVFNGSITDGRSRESGGRILRMVSFF